MLRFLQRQQCECLNRATNAVIAHLTLKSKPTANIHTEKNKAFALFKAKIKNGCLDLDQQKKY